MNSLINNWNGIRSWYWRPTIRTSIRSCASAFWNLSRFAIRAVTSATKAKVNILRNWITSSFCLFRNGIYRLVSQRLKDQRNDGDFDFDPAAGSRERGRGDVRRPSWWHERRSWFPQPDRYRWIQSFISGLIGSILWGVHWGFGAFQSFPGIHRYLTQIECFFYYC